MVTIASKLTRILLAILAAVFLVSTVIKLYIVYVELHESLHKQMQRVQKRLTLNLSPAIWDLRFDFVQKIVDTELLDSKIDGIVVNDIDSRQIASRCNKAFDPDNLPMIEFKKSFAISYMNEDIAYVNIYYNSDHIWENIQTKALRLTVDAFAMIAIFILLFQIAINKYIIRYIKELTSKILDISNNKNFDKEVKLQTNDELSLLAREFDKMRIEVKKSWDELRQLNQSLEKKIEQEVKLGRQKDQQLHKQAKMAQMGEMISNIAHHWRQPLSAISTLATGARVQGEMGILSQGECCNIYEQITQQTNKLSQTIEEFREFSIDTNTYESIDLTQVIKKAVHLLQDNFQMHTIEIENRVKKEYIIKGYKSEIAQVLLNIFNNSIDAFINNKNQTNKKIQIDIDADEKSVTLLILDNAGGIPEDILDKIFDPYFTTKHQSQGTGLSLYMCKEIVQTHHNGDLDIQNHDQGVLTSIKFHTAN